MLTHAHPEAESCLSAGSPGASLWDASVAAAQARGETVSLYAPPAQTPHPAKLYTGFGLEQEPAQPRPLADSFLQIDRCAAHLCLLLAAHESCRVLGLSCPTMQQSGFLLHRDSVAPQHVMPGTILAGRKNHVHCGSPRSTQVVASNAEVLCRIDFAAPAPAPGGGELSIRTLKQGDGDRQPHYWDSAQGTDLAAEAPLLDWGEVPPSSAVGASPAAMPAEATPTPAPHYWDATEPVSLEAPSPSSEDAPQGSDPQIYEHHWRMPNQAFGKVPDDGTFPAQVRRHPLECWNHGAP